MVKKYLRLLILLCLTPRLAFAVECLNNTQQHQYYCTYSTASASGVDMKSACSDVYSALGSPGHTFVNDGSLCTYRSGTQLKLINCTISPHADCGCTYDQQTVVDGGGDAQWCGDPVPDPLDDLSECTDSVAADAGLCGGFPAECEAAGGTFGWAGAGENMNPVCLPNDYGGAAPECGVDLVCNDPYPGENSDQDDPNITDRPDPDGSSQTAASKGIPGTDSGTGQPCDASAGGTCVPNDTNGNGKCDPDEPNCTTQSDKSEGACDPEAENYLACVGMLTDDPGLESWADRLVDDARDNSLSIIDSEMRGALDGGGLDQDTSALEDTAHGLLPSFTCQDITTQILTRDLTISCADTQLMRDIFAWIIYAGTAWSIIGVFLRRSEVA